MNAIKSVPTPIMGVPQGVPRNSSVRNQCEPSLEREANDTKSLTECHFNTSLLTEKPVSGRTSVLDDELCQILQTDVNEIFHLPKTEISYCQVQFEPIIFWH